MTYIAIIRKDVMDKANTWMNEMRVYAVDVLKRILMGALKIINELITEI